MFNVHDTRASVPQETLHERIEHEQIHRLIEAINESSGAARTAWLFYLALMAYFLVAIASVGHQDLLLNSPVELPFLGINIDLVKFFAFAPAILLLVHFGVYHQHVFLSRKARHLDDAFRKRERANRALPRSDELRTRVHSYFFTQIHAGGERSALVAASLHLMNDVSFVLLPIILFLYFQIAFLPYHDYDMTNLHRLYLLADLLMIALMQSWMRKAQPSASSLAMIRRGGVRFAMNLGSLAVLFFSVCVATVPDDIGDRYLSTLPAPFSVPVPMKITCHDTMPGPDLGLCDFLEDEPVPEFADNKSTGRRAFILTAFFFEGQPRLSTGTASSIFSRNLIVTDTNLSVARTDYTEAISGEGRNRAVTPNQRTIERVNLSLRGRDLRYALFERSNFTGADFTASWLDGASFRGAVMRQATFSCARKPLKSVIGGRYSHCARAFLANFEGADLSHTDMSGACFSGSRLKTANLEGANFYKADLQFAQLDFANMRGADLSWSKLGGSRFLEADLRYSTFRFARFEGAPVEELAALRDSTAEESFADDECGRLLPDRLFERFKEREKRTTTVVLRKADLALADLRLANLQGADLRSARLIGADLVLTQLQTARLIESDLTGANLSFAHLHGANLSGARLILAQLNEAKLQGAVLRSATLYGSDLNGAELQGADLRFAKLANAQLQDADLRGADMRCALASENLAEWLEEKHEIPGLDATKVSSTPSLTQTTGAEMTEVRELEAALKKLKERRLSLLAKERAMTGVQSSDTSTDDLIDRVRRLDKELDAQLVASPQTCQHSAGTSLDAQAQKQLGRELVEAICGDPTNTRFIFKGIVNRVVHSFGENSPEFQTSPGMLLKEMRLKKIVPDTKASEHKKARDHKKQAADKVEEAGTTKPQTCFEAAIRADPRAVLQLTLSAHLHEAAAETEFTR